MTIAIASQQRVTTGYNSSGSSIAAGKFVKLTTTSNRNLSYIALAGAGEDAIGVTMEAIADGAVGNILTQGIIEVTAGTGGYTVGGGVQADTSGGNIPLTANKYKLGVARNTASAAATVSLDILCPGSWYEA